MQQVHTNARLSVFYAGCFKNRIAQARMNDTFELVAATLQVPVSKLPSSRTITEQIEAIAALQTATTMVGCSNVRVSSKVGAQRARK
jgi:hypothetical protein